MSWYLKRTSCRCNKNILRPIHTKRKQMGKRKRSKNNQNRSKKKIQTSKFHFHVHFCSVWMDPWIVFRPNESEYESERKISLMFAAYSLIVFLFRSRFRFVWTRIHSSRMRTVRCSGHRGGGVCPEVGGVCPVGCLPGGVYPSMHWAGGVCPSACWDTQPLIPYSWGVSQHALGRGVYAPVHGGIHNPLSLREQNDWQTAVKILPCRNFVADGNKPLYLYLEYDTKVVGLEVCVDGDEISPEDHAVHASLEPASVLVLRVVVHEHCVTTLSRLGPVPRTTWSSFEFSRFEVYSSLTNHQRLNWPLVLIYMTYQW